MRPIILTLTLILFSSCSDSREDPIKILKDEKEGVKGLNLFVDPATIIWRYENGYLYFTLPAPDIQAEVTIYKQKENSEDTNWDNFITIQINANNTTIYIGTLPGLYIICITTPVNSVTNNLIIK